MDTQYLNTNGIQYLWSKIKAYIDSLYSSLVLTVSHFGNPVQMNNSSTIDLSDGDVFIKTISADTTFSITGVPSGKTATFSLILNSGGNYSVFWPNNVKWSFGISPTLTNNGQDMITFLTPDGGTTWYGSLSVQSAQNS